MEYVGWSLAAGGFVYLLFVMANWLQYRHFARPRYLLSLRHRTRFQDDFAASHRT